MFALGTLGVWAQETISVKFQGAAPDIFDGMTFLRYTNATKRMTYCEAPGFEVVYESGTSYSLPRTGKDIMMNKWDGGMKVQTALKWNGHGFGK